MLNLTIHLRPINRSATTLGHFFRILRKSIARILVPIDTILFNLQATDETALVAAPGRVAEAFGSDVGAVEKVAVVEFSVGGEGAVFAEDDVVDVDAVVFFWFAAAGEEEVGVVAHFGGILRWWRGVEGFFVGVGGGVGMDGRGLGFLRFVVKVEGIEGVKKRNGEEKTSLFIGKRFALHSLKAMEAAP